MRRRGFTQTELIVVLFVVILLAAILIPMMRQRHWNYELNENAGRCWSNLRQVGLGLLQYTQDYDKKFPVARSGGKYYGWADATQPYHRSEQVYHCPKERAIHAFGRPPKQGYITYFYNSNLQTKERSFSFAHSIIMLGEAPPANARSVFNGCRSTPCAPDEAGQPAVLPGAANRHLGGALYCFTDGHVKWFKAESSTRSPEIMSGNTRPEPRNYTFGVQ